MVNHVFPPIILLLLFFFITACKNCKEDPPIVPPTLTCGGGYVVQEDSCVCPTGNYEGYGTCRTLRANEFWGISYGCVCQDTVSMWFFEGMQEGDMDIEFSGRGPGKKRKTATSSWSAKYFDLPDGDSIFIKNQGFLIPCQFPDGRFAEPSATGKFIHPDTMIMTLYWHHVHYPFPVLDTCQIVFHR